MKRVPVLIAAVISLGLLTTAHAQMGSSWFSKPAIAEVINPVVGKGAQYQTTQGDKSNSGPEVQEITIVGKESVDGKDGFWMEIAHQEKNQSGMMYAKVLFTKDDFQFTRMIMQQPGQPAMEMPFHTTDKAKSRMHDEIEKWTAAGTETITVPRRHRRQRRLDQRQSNTLRNCKRGFAGPYHGAGQGNHRRHRPHHRPRENFRPRGDEAPNDAAHAATETAIALNRTAGLSR
jgi:hypothetical protein